MTSRSFFPSFFSPLLITSRFLACGTDYRFPFEHGKKIRGQQGESVLGLWWGQESTERERRVYHTHERNVRDIVGYENASKEEPICGLQISDSSGRQRRVIVQNANKIEIKFLIKDLNKERKWQNKNQQTNKQTNNTQEIELRNSDVLCFTIALPNDGGDQGGRSETRSSQTPTTLGIEIVEDNKSRILSKRKM